ncbi:MAG TPA: anthranilate phosphoribosyltransferase [Acidobacteriaceae bacterium]|nr:anthranilate phosphoribosyltransferase [Acidobacteriaceae bacterium]
MTVLTRTLQLLAQRGATLSREQARAAMQVILADTNNQIPDEQIAELLTVLAARAVTSDELAGFADVMRATAAPLQLSSAEREDLVDTCGTGGDASGTFNISTGVALVAAAAGAKIAKHGNRSLTSRCGSADVLDALGVPTALSPDQAVACLRATGFAFLFAPLMHPAMKRVQHIRRAIGIRTVFNVLGPLTNPAHAPAQILGVYGADLVPVIAEAMLKLGMRRGFVVHGCDGLDEISLSGETEMAEVKEGTISLRRFSPEEAGVERADLTDLQGGDAAENAAILQAIFAGEAGPRRHIVLLNAAAALVAAGVAGDFRTGVERAAHSIDSGKAKEKLSSLVDFGRQGLPAENRPRP